MMKKSVFYFLSFLSLLIITASAYGQVDLDQNLVAYYPLNGNGNDASPNGYNTSTSGSPDPVTDHIGNAAMAMSFNGTSDNYYTTNDVFTGMDKFTISVWFNTSVLASQIMVGKHAGSTSGEWYFGMVNDGNIRFMHLNTGGNRSDLNVAYPYNDGQWHHAVAVYDGSKMEIFIDGTSIGSQARSGNTKEHDDINLHIGNYAGTGWYFNGMLDEVHIYNRALNTAEIAALGRNTEITIGNINSVCAGDAFSIPFTVSGTSLESDNTFTAYLSDVNGSFSAKKIIGSVTGTGSGTINASIDKNALTGSGYKVMIVSSNQPLASVVDNGATISVTNAVEGVDLSSNLFGYFPFNGNSGDSSGYGRNLSKNGTITVSEDRYGDAGKAYTFDGGYMNWGKISQINNGGSALTIAMWLKPSEFSTHFIPIANNWNTAHGGIYMGINDSGNGIRWRVNNEYVCIGPDLTLNEWVHVTCVFGSDRLRIYYNGVEVKNSACPANIDAVNMDFMLGRESSGTSNVHYKGGMDDVRFIERELSPDEVKAVYHNGLAFNNSGLCVDETLELSTITIPGATYSWTGPDGFSSTDQNPSIPNVTSDNAGVYTLTITNNGCTHQSTAQIIINTELETVSASNDGPICEGETLTLSSTTIPGAAYSWSGPNSFTSTDQNPELAGALPAATGTYTVTVTKGACTREANTNATVHAIPATPTAGSNSPVCEGSTLNLTASTVPGATYSWSGPKSFNSTNQNPSRTNMETDEAGTYSVKAIANGCVSPTADVVVTVNAVGSISAANDGPVCTGEDINLSVTTISGATYSWNGPDGYTSTDQNPVINIADTDASGTYTVTVTANGCSKQTTTNVTVHAPPAEPTAGNNGPICEGEDLFLTAANIPGATYSWSGPNGFSSNSQNPSILGTTTTAASGTYTVVATISGCTNQSTTNVTINPSPSIPTASNNGPVCEGEDFDLTAATVSGATYSWSGPNGFTSTDQNPTIFTATAAASGTYTVTATIGSCSKQSTTTATVNALPVANAGGDFSICEGTTLNLSANTVTGASYSWSGPNGFSSTSEDPSIPSATTSAAGTYILTITVGTCSDQDEVDVTVNPAPAAPVAGSNSPVCVGDDINLTASTVAGATYSWSGPNGFTSTDQNPSILSATTAASGTYTVTATIGSCSEQSTITVTVSSPPVANAGGDFSICEGTTLNLSANTVTGASYSWSGPNGFSSTSEDPSIPSATTSAAGTYIVTITVGTCSDQDEVDVTVNPAPAAPVAGSNSPVCAGDDINLTASTVAGATYSWSGPNGFTSTDQNPTRSSVTTSHAGTYTFVITVGSCQSAPESVNVTVNSLSSVTAFNDGPYCTGEPIQLNANTVAGATYSWSGPNGFTSSDEDPTISNSTTAAAGTYTVTVTLGGCTDQSTTSVTVNSGPAKPTITLQQFPDRLVSSSFTGNQWSKDGAELFGQTSQSLVFPDPGVYTVIVTGTNGCSTTSDPYYYGVSSTSNGNGIGSITAYPNPSEGIFQIKAENIQTKELNLTIQNALGIEVSRERFTVSSGSIITDLNLQHLAEGVYYLHFDTGNAQSIVKVVIQ